MSDSTCPSSLVQILINDKRIAHTFLFHRRHLRAVQHLLPTFIMKHAPARSIPPPIDLSVSGSNLRRVDPSDTPDKEQTMGCHHPYTYTCKYIIEVDEATSPAPTLTPPTDNFSPSLTPGPNQALTPSSPYFKAPSTSKSAGSLLPPSEWNGTKLVPNRRRRSYSEVCCLSVTSPTY